MLHSELFPEFPCDSELIPVEALSTERICVLWCSGCSTEITYTPDCEWGVGCLSGDEDGPGDVTCL
jgi:hypothetical protein